MTVTASGGSSLAKPQLYQTLPAATIAQAEQVHEVLGRESEQVVVVQHRPLGGRVALGMAGTALVLERAVEPTLEETVALCGMCDESLMEVLNRGDLFFVGGEVADQGIGVLLQAFAGQVEAFGQRSAVGGGQKVYREHLKPPCSGARRAKNVELRASGQDQWGQSVSAIRFWSAAVLP